MHFVYGSFNGSARDTSMEYQHGYPNPRHPSKGTSLSEGNRRILAPSYLGQGIAMTKVKRKCKILHMLIYQLVLYGLHMKQASFRKEYGICCMMYSFIPFIYSPCKRYNNLWFHKTVDEFRFLAVYFYLMRQYSQRAD